MMSAASDPSADTVPASRAAPGVDVSTTSSRRPSPPRVVAAPRHSWTVTRRPARRAPNGNAKTSVSAPSGWTTSRDPYPSAATCNAAPAPLSRTESHHTGVIGAVRGPGRDATRSWTTAPRA